MLSAPASAFPTTRWTLIVDASSSAEARRAALTYLLTVYARPLFAYFQRHGLSAPDAADAVQDVAVQLIEGDVLARLTPERGRLRGYLRTAAANWLVKRHERATADKRGGGAAVIPLDALRAGDEPPAESESPEAAFERAWAEAVMQRALRALQAEFDAGLRAGPFALVTQFFGAGPAPSYRDAAAQHGMSVPQLKAFLHRARVRFAELVNAEVSDTVADASLRADEVSALRGARL